MPHVLLMSSYYPSTKKPARAIYCRETALALARAGHQVGVLVSPELRFWPVGLRCFHSLHHVLRSRYTIENDQGLATYRYHASLPFHWAKASGCLTNYWGERLFRKYCDEHGQPDVIHAHFAFYSGLLGSHLKFKYKIPVVLTEHHTQIQLKRLNTGQKKALNVLSKNIDKIVAVGPQLATSLRDFIPDREIEVVGNFVDPGRFQADYRRLPKSPFIFTVVSNLYPQKGVDVLMEAFSRAFKNEDTILKICGDGPERKRLQNQARNKGISDQVKFLGKLPNEQVAQCIQESHAVVCSSRFETFGIPLIEAMSCGKPVVSTQCGGPEHFVEKTNGFLVPAEDAASLANALQKMRKEYSSFCSDTIRADCLKRFGVETFIKRYENIYEEVMAVNRNSQL